MERWTNEQIDFLKNNYNIMSYAEISSIIDKSEGSIRAKCHDLKLVKKNKWSDDEIDFLTKNYTKLSTKQIAFALNRTESSIQLKANKLGLKKSPYYCNYRFFSDINTEEKAYWLGFISADGWMSKNDKSNAGVVGIELQYRDIDHLKKFNKSINGNYTIAERYKTCQIYDEYSDKLHRMCNIRIYSLDMYNDLLQLGLHNNKTYEMHLPDISSELMHHFIRGYFDGDGCIRIKTLSKKDKNGDNIKVPSCDFTCKSYDFISSLRTLLFEQYNIGSCITQENTGVYRLYIYNSNHNLENFINLLYNNSTVYLDRKYKIYQNILHLHNTQLPRQSEMIGFFNSAKENGKAETPIRMEGCV